MKEYQANLDAIKGLSIIAIVLYHIGVMPYGFLGVDTFFVINGFFIIPSLCKSIESGTFNYFSFLKKRLSRLMPLVIIATAICIGIGYIGMMPNDYENLCESIVATNVCANNILAAITTKNYWAIVNAFKPLMHTWYIGILVQFYFIFPLIMMFVSWCGKSFHANIKYLFRVILLIIIGSSVVGYLLPSISYATKFYQLPFRLFELCSGGFVGLIVTKDIEILSFKYIKSIALLGLLFCFIFPIENFQSINNVIPIGADGTQGGGGTK